MTNIIVIVMMLFVFIFGYCITDLFMKYYDENCRDGRKSGRRKG